ncbi:hypothetical protein GGI23_001388 [Coemansia sp. RSA 2559]|nr:hypothetical protein GGI23_001388 [Coemansia sp. RSA 2559]KAJ2863105.1 hypothetical protein GGI22_002040 [Coemansia erecta]
MKQQSIAGISQRFKRATKRIIYRRQNVGIVANSSYSGTLSADIGAADADELDDIDTYEAVIYWPCLDSMPLSAALACAKITKHNHLDSVPLFTSAGSDDDTLVVTETKKTTRPKKVTWADPLTEVINPVQRKTVTWANPLAEVMNPIEPKKVTWADRLTEAEEEANIAPPAELEVDPRTDTTFAFPSAVDLTCQRKKPFTCKSLFGRMATSKISAPPKHTSTFTGVTLVI